VLIGQFWDGTRWRIHTRTVMDATCNYYSQTKNFATMFAEAALPGLQDSLDKTVCYSWNLQHPENRIVVEVKHPRLILVGAHRGLERVPREELVRSLSETLFPKQHTFETTHAVTLAMRSWETLYHYNFQGLVFLNKTTGDRWKIRTDSYNKARLLRGNTPRRDFLWLSAWRDNKLNDYERLFPEETPRIRSMMNRWKDITSEVYTLYMEKYKARHEIDIPVKYKGLLYALHKHYFEVLKKDGKTVTFKHLIEWMNQRDIPQMLYLINYELRAVPEPVHSAAPEAPVLTALQAAAVSPPVLTVSEVPAPCNPPATATPAAKPATPAAKPATPIAESAPPS